MDLSGLSGLLGVEKPWEITNIKVQHLNKVVDVYLDYERGSMFHCPSCGNKTKIHDSSYKKDTSFRFV